MRTEKGLTILFIIGIFFKMLHWEGSGIMLTLSLCGLAMVYFPAAFYFFTDKTIKRQNLALSIISGFLLSLIPIGILFKIQHWVGGQLYLLLGLFIAPAFLAITYFLKSKAPEELRTYYRNMAIRTTVLTVLTFLFYFTSAATLLKIQYWNDPEMARVKALHYGNPDNEDFKRQHDEYIAKRNASEG